MDFGTPLRTYLRQLSDESTRFEISQEALLKMVEALRTSEEEMGL